MSDDNPYASPTERAQAATIAAAVASGIRLGRVDRFTEQWRMSHAWGQVVLVTIVWVALVRWVFPSTPTLLPLGAAVVGAAVLWPLCWGNGPAVLARFCSNPRPMNSLLVHVVLNPRAAPSQEVDDIGELWIEGSWLRFRGDWVELDLDSSDVMRLEEQSTRGWISLMGPSYCLRLRRPIEGRTGVLIHSREGWLSPAMIQSGRVLRRRLSRWISQAER